MPRLCITAKLACPVERVWETVTELSRQDLRIDLARV